MTNLGTKLEREPTDADLVARSLAGRSDAFGTIVTRYQSLVCSLAYCATGSLSESEDLAQETFVVAWKRLGTLREPARLRAWICQIARHHIHDALRAQGREPSHAAEPLDQADAAPASEPLPADHAISREEEAILWRSIERIPPLYREPLVLFYREHHSVERVAAVLDLNEDAVKQRLSRGRRLLQEEIAAFVEGALERTNPGKAFTLGVLALLPAYSLPTTAAGLASAKGGMTAKAAAGVSGLLLSPMVVFAGLYSGYRLGLDAAVSDRERAGIRRFYRQLGIGIGGFIATFAGLMLWARPHAAVHPRLFQALVLGLGGATTLGTAALLASLGHRILAARRRDLAGASTDAPHSPNWEYRSGIRFLGLPLYHIRLSGGRWEPVRAWIAIGTPAIGGLFAFGGLAVAPLSVGGCAIGFMSWGTLAIGGVSLAAFAVGIWPTGGLAIGWQAIGSCAIGWRSAAGFVTLAHDFATGTVAQAAQANTALAYHAVESGFGGSVYRSVEFLNRFGLLLNLFWVVPLFVWSRAARRRRQQALRHSRPDSP